MTGMSGVLHINGVAHPNAFIGSDAPQASPPVKMWTSGNKILFQSDSTDTKTESISEEIAKTDAKEKMAAKDRFAEKMLERCQKEMSKRPATEQSDENAQLLADSLVSAVEDIEKVFGTKYANQFMSAVLGATDEKVDETRLAAAIKSFFSSLSGAGFSRAEVASLSGKFNKGLEVIANWSGPNGTRPVGIFNELAANPVIDSTQDPIPVNDDASGGAGPEDVGLAYAMNVFFGTVEVESDGKSGLIVRLKDFDLDYNWVTLSNEPVANPGAGITAREFTKSEEADGIIKYLTEVTGCEDAAQYLSGLSEGVDFLQGVAMAVAIVVEQKGLQAGEDFVEYLNDHLKGAIDANHPGVTFHGWRLTGKDEEVPANFERPENPDFWFLSEEVAKKNHRGLITKWKDDATGVGAYDTEDLDQLYARFQSMKSGQAEDPGAVVKEPKGNLVDTMA